MAEYVPTTDEVARVILMNSSHSRECYREHWCYDCIAKATVQATAVLALLDPKEEK